MTDRYESRASTHAEGCWDWGPGHYGCAVGEIKRLREMLQRAFQRGYQSGARGLREMYDAVQAVKRQDAWGNTRLTEALIEAEERAERAEAENKRLREELSKMRAKPVAAVVREHDGRAFAVLRDAGADLPDGTELYAAIDAAVRKEGRGDE